MDTTRGIRAMVLAVSVGLLLAGTPFAEATNRYVSATSGSPTSPYTNWATAALRIEDAIAVSVASDVIWVTNGTYASTGVVANAAMLSVTNGITLRSVNGAGVTIIDGNYPAVTNRCLFLSHASAVVEGFTLRNGYASGSGVTNHGGGVYVQANGTVRNCLIMLNTAAGDGGGIYVMTNATVASCTIASNTALTAGGGLVAQTNVTVQNSILYFNTAPASANWYTNRAATISYTFASPVPAGTGNSANDPQCVDVATGDFHLRTNSPCVNAAAYQSWMETAVDLDGQPRIIGGAADIGVDEYTRVFHVARHGANANPGTQGSPWATIPYAITNAAITNGDTILIGEGVYTNPVTFNARVGLNVIGGYNTNDWSWAPAAHPTVIQPVVNTIDAITVSVQPQSFKGLTVTGGRYGIYATAGNQSRMYVTQCIVSNNASHGIWLNASKQAIFCVNTLIAGNGGNGLTFNTDNNALGSPVYNCTIADNGGHGLYDHYLTVGLDIRNTIIAGNRQYGFYQHNLSHQPVTIRNSTIFGNTNGNVYAFEANKNLSLLSGTMFATPLFIGGGDYRLQNGSPCVGYGADLSAFGVAIDLENTTRGSSVDMGCYQSAHTAASRLPATYADASRPDESGDGSAWATAKKTIGMALAFTAPGGTCTVAAATYAENVYVPANTTLMGTNRSTTVVTAGWYVVSMVETNAKVQSLTMRSGLRGVDITADYNTVQDCILINNTNGLGHGRPGAKVNECLITSNVIYGINSALPSNMGIPGGVGLTVRNTLIARNGSSGAYLNWDNGGANWSQWWNCTIVSNGLHGYQASTYNSHAYITNTILAWNAGYGTHIVTGGSAKQYLNYSCVFGNVSGTHYNNTQTPVIGANMVNADPALDTSWRLQGGSPCIDAGMTITGITNDVDGAARTNAFDVGCYESAFAAASKFDMVYVDASRPDESGAGTNWVTAKKTIGAGLSVLTPTGTVNVAAGFYREAVSIPANTTVAGTDWTSTIISNGGSVVTMSATNAYLREVTVLGGTYGIAMSGARNFARRCILRNNSNSGVYITATSNRLDECVMHNNPYGVQVPGGNYAYYTLDRCVVASNTSHGVYQTGGNPGAPAGRVLNSLLVANGGDGFSSQVDNSTQGGTWLYNCTVVNNAGNGIYDNYLTIAMDVRNCIIYDNGGAGIRQNSGLGHSTFNITSSCVFSNRSGNFASALATGTMRLQAGCMTADPLFVGGGNYRLQGLSPCLGYGTTNGLLGIVSNDLDGVARSAPFDMGCYESASNPVVRSAAQYVNGASGNDAADGTSWGTAKKTIGSGLALTASGGTCYAATGTYSDTVILPAMVTLEGADRDRTVVTSAWHVAYLPETNSVVRQMTLQGGLYGVFQTAKTGVVDRCTLRNNNVGYYAEGVRYGGWKAVVNRTILTNNTSHGMATLESAVTAVNSLFAKNGGDGLLINADFPGIYTFANFCTFADNGSSGYEDSNGSHQGTYLTNCISSSNVVNGIRFTRLNADTIAYSCVYGNAGGNFSSMSLTIGAGMITNQTPQFRADFNGSVYALAEASPCLDSGLNIGITNDITGSIRPIAGRKPLVGSGYDMGAYELWPTPKGATFTFR
jgi:hypothetical protein